MLVGNEDDGGHVVVRYGRSPRDWAGAASSPAEDGCALFPQVAHTCWAIIAEYRKDVMGPPTADGFVNERGVVIVSNSMGTSHEGMEKRIAGRDAASPSTAPRWPTRQTARTARAS